MTRLDELDNEGKREHSELRRRSHCSSCGEKDYLDNLVKYDGLHFHLACATDLRKCRNCGKVFEIKDAFHKNNPIKLKFYCCPDCGEACGEEAREK